MKLIVKSKNMSNMKKIYQAPSMEVVLLQTSNSMLAGSVEVSNNTYNSGTNGAIRSRSYRWDDDEE